MVDDRQAPAELAIDHRSVPLGPLLLGQQQDFVDLLQQRAQLDRVDRGALGVRVGLGPGHALFGQDGRLLVDGRHLLNKRVDLAVEE